MLCFEWGISWKEYCDTPFEIIGKLKRYKEGETHGQKRKEQSKK